MPIEAILAEAPSITPARMATFDLSATGSVLLSKAAVVVGWAVAETSGSAAAALDVYALQAAQGTPPVPIRLAAGASTVAYLGPDGLDFAGGIFVDVTSGAAEGSVWYLPVR